MLHPQARALIDRTEQSGLPPTHALSPVEARKAYRAKCFATQPAPPEAALVRDLQAYGPHGAIPLRLYRPRRAEPAARLSVLVYFHGGGWVTGDLDTHDVLCREFANAADIAVIAVDYRLAPEHRFPVAVDDCLAATYWVQRNALALGVDPARLAVGGDSAGGNLAAVVAIEARNAGNLPIVFQLLIYPVTDQRRNAPSHQTYGKGYQLTSDTVGYYHRHYIGEPAHDLDWRASPLLHEDLTRLPPAFVLTAGHDPLRDEGLAYSQRLSEAGTCATHICFERQLHGFIKMGKVLDEANAAVSLCAAELRRSLST